MFELSASRRFMCDPYGYLNAAERLETQQPQHLDFKAVDANSMVWSPWSKQSGIQPLDFRGIWGFPRMLGAQKKTLDGLSWVTSHIKTMDDSHGGSPMTSEKASFLLVEVRTSPRRWPSLRAQLVARVISVGLFWMFPVIDVPMNIHMNIHMNIPMRHKCNMAIFHILLKK